MFGQCSKALGNAQKNNVKKEHDDVLLHREGRTKSITASSLDAAPWTSDK